MRSLDETMPETIDITPDWQGVFRFAIAICRDGMSEDDGSELVIEMLEFGARLEAARTKATGQEEEE